LDTAYQAQKCRFYTRIPPFSSLKPDTAWNNRSESALDRLHGLSGARSGAGSITSSTAIALSRPVNQHGLSGAYLTAYEAHFCPAYQAQRLGPLGAGNAGIAVNFKDMMSA
jgi:hypothetical protein